MIDRKSFENGSPRAASAKRRFCAASVAGSSPRNLGLRVGNGISSAFKSRHMGNVGLRRAPGMLASGDPNWQPWPCAGAAAGFE